MSLFFALFSFLDPYDDDLKVKTQRPRSADQPGVFQAQTGESPWATELVNDEKRSFCWILPAW